MPREGSQLAFALRIPQLQRLVVASRDDGVSIRRECNGIDRIYLPRLGLAGHVRSRHPTAGASCRLLPRLMVCPSGENATALKLFIALEKYAVLPAFATSHSFSVLSLLAVIMVRPSGAKAADVMPDECPMVGDDIDRQTRRILRSRLEGRLRASIVLRARQHQATAALRPAIPQRCR